VAYAALAATACSPSWGQILEDANPEDQGMIPGKLSPPVRLLWNTIGKRQYSRYIRRIRGS
jgi:hypothetical protein